MAEIVSSPDVTTANAPSPLADIGRLLISCEDRPGIVATVSRFLFDQGANILNSAQHSTDPSGGRFFMRVEFHLPGLDAAHEAVRAAFAGIGAQFDMEWSLHLASHRKRIALFVSLADHAMQELLWRQRTDDLHADIVCVVSNHQRLASVAAQWDVPYHHIPIEKGRKAETEAAQLELAASYNADVIVLARYMQIISNDFLARFPGDVINIHHSFLPAFIGADPYRAAYDRGVKLIGATAHYVTEELDAGPIIEQDVQRVDHRQSVAELRRIGRFIEREVLARAVTWHVQDRVIVYGNRTVVFT